MSNANVDAQTGEAGAAPINPVDRYGITRLVVIVGLATFADWLFYLRPVGISLPVFVLAVSLGSVIANPVRTSLGRLALAAALVVLACVPLVLTPTVFAVLIAFFAAAHFAVVIATKVDLPARDLAYSAVRLLKDCGWRLIVDLLAWPWPQRPDNLGARLMAWVVPLLLGATFVLLFAAANPLIDTWLRAVNLWAALRQIEFFRVGFWLFVALMVWPFVFVRVRARAANKTIKEPTPPLPAALSAHLFGKPALLRSLILFNALFAVETGLDVAYLWGGVALPDGMTYAAYAHRGAYPLILTALLAAGFVIAVMQPKSDAAGSRLLRWLVYLWVAQNVLLVLSSLLRLDLYVETYSLTYWRVAAFVWMLLIAMGLILIIARIATNRSNAWLIRANLISLAATIYACGFINFPRVIADFNVQHSRELSGDGANLDVNYLARLGAQAIPALDRFIAHVATSQETWQTGQASRARRVRSELAQDHSDSMRDWRAWTYWDGQIGDYLSSHPIAPQTTQPDH